MLPYTGVLELCWFSYAALNFAFAYILLEANPKSK